MTATTSTPTTGICSTSPMCLLGRKLSQGPKPPVAGTSPAHAPDTEGTPETRATGQPRTEPRISASEDMEGPNQTDVRGAPAVPVPLPNERAQAEPIVAPRVQRIDTGPLAGELEVGDARKLARVKRSIPPKPSGSYIPSYVVDVASAGDLTIGAVSVRGLSHLDFATVRQDAMAFGATKTGDYVIGTIADGVSSASESHLGADAAAKAALNVVRAALEGGQTPESLDWEGASGTTRRAVRARAEAGLKPGVGGSGGLSSIADEEFVKVVGTTAEVLVVETHPTGEGSYRFTRAVMSGDGYGYRLSPEGWIPLGTSKDSIGGVLSNVVSAPLPRDPGPPVLHHGVLFPGEAVLIATDGVGDGVQSGGTEVAAYLQRIMRPLAPHALLELVSYVAFQSDDDRTVFVVWA